MREPDDFIDFIKQLLGGGDLDGVAKGVAEHAVSNGWDSLTPKQHAALVIAITQWIAGHFDGYKPGFIQYPEQPPTPECTESQDEVPWSEVYLAGAMFHGRCSYCQQVHHKDD